MVLVSLLFPLLLFILMLVLFRVEQALIPLEQEPQPDNAAMEDAGTEPAAVQKTVQTVVQEPGAEVLEADGLAAATASSAASPDGGAAHSAPADAPAVSADPVQQGHGRRWLLQHVLPWESATPPTAPPTDGSGREHPLRSLMDRTALRPHPSGLGFRRDGRRRRDTRRGRRLDRRSSHERRAA